ncbi:hypothetical protein [Streptomyces sp. TLI_171]|uniref:hypothetical protein n=1 Tax=Streptomyces sp. TLI_171 TaxID=1938859 RepID=UPI00117D4CAE|nr:hypothetical protein [Streptomyces sp. TLI_171]
MAPRGYRPVPGIGAITGPECEEAAGRGGWLFRADPGHDPDGPVPPEAVTGAWQVDRQGRPLRFWPNPRHGAPVEPAAPAEGPPVAVPPLLAGRRPAGRALLGWLDDARAPRLCRIAGSSGSGRTHLLHWLATACPPDHPRAGRRVHAVLAAAELTFDTFVWRLAAALGVAAGGPDDLLAALIDGVPRVLVVTDLDRAGSDGLVPDAPQRIAAEVLRPLLGVPWLRIVVECATGTPAAEALDVPAAVLDLDDPRWTDREAFADWAAGLAGRQLPDGVYPSPALALLAARTAPGPVLDPAGPPGERAEALAGAWWASVPEASRVPISTLAGIGEGLDTELWSELPGGGGPAAVHAATALLLPPDGRGRYRVWPREFGEHLAEWRLDHLSLRQNLLPEEPGPADADRLGLVLRHAVRTGTPADDLLADPAVLAHADPPAVDTALTHRPAAAREAPADTAPDGTEPVPRQAVRTASSADDPLTDPAVPDLADRPAAGERDRPSVVRRAWRAAGPLVAGTADPAVRASALHAWLGGADQPLADGLAELSGQAWRSRWAVPRSTEPVYLLARENGPLRAHHVAVASGWEIGTLDPATGRSSATDPLRLEDRSTVALATGADGSAYPLLRSGAVRPVRPSGLDGAPSPALGELLATLDEGATAIAARGGEHRVLVLGDAAGRVHLREDRPEAQAVRSAQTLTAGPVTAVDTTWHDGAHLVAVGGRDGSVRTWAPGQDALPAPLFTRSAPVTAVALAGTPHGLFAAAGWADGAVRIARWGGRPTLVELQLGTPVVGLAVTDGGRICAATPNGVLALDLDGSDPAEP